MALVDIKGDRQQRQRSASGGRGTEELNAKKKAAVEQLGIARTSDGALVNKSSFPLRLYLHKHSDVLH
jgi:hypothetical protein